MFPLGIAGSSPVLGTKTKTMIFIVILFLIPRDENRRSWVSKANPGSPSGIRVLSSAQFQILAFRCKILLMTEIIHLNPNHIRHNFNFYLILIPVIAFALALAILAAKSYKSETTILGVATEAQIGK
jgi:hypothetical protein